MYSTDPCLWVRDTLNKRDMCGKVYRMAQAESLRCKSDGHIFCRPCWIKFFGED